MATENCPYTVGRRVCTAGLRGHAGRHEWPKPPTCRGRLSHQTRPAYARVWFNDDQPDSGPLYVCRTCSKEMLTWMLAGTVNAVGQYPTAHYPIERI